MAAKQEKPKITVKQAKFIRAKAAGKKNPDAYIEAGYKASTRNVARVESSKLLKKPNVQEALQLALEKNGLTPDRIMKVVSDGMDATKVTIVRDPAGGEESAFAEETPDHSIRLKAAGMAAGFMGLNKQEGNTLNINFNQVVNADKDDYGL